VFTLLLLVRNEKHIYMGAILSAHPVRGASRMRRHADWVASTLAYLMNSRMSYLMSAKWFHSQKPFR